MGQVLSIARFSVRELMRSRWIGAYALFFAASGWLVFALGEEPTQAVVSVLELVLFVAPLVSLVVAVLYFYSLRDFAELLLTQPIARRTAFAGQYLGLSLALAGSFVAGLGVPFLWYGSSAAAARGIFAMLLLAGVLLTLAFVALAFAVSVRTENRLKALGAVLLVWLFFAVIYDGLLMMLIVAFPQTRLDRELLGLALLDPLDMARILILLRLDVAALMGYTGVVFQEFFGSMEGIAVALGALGAWIAAPLWLGLRAYERRDF